MLLLWITIGVILGAVVQRFLYQPHLSKGLHFRMHTDRNMVEEGGMLQLEQRLANRMLKPFSQIRTSLRLNDGLSDKPEAYVADVYRNYPHQTYLLSRQSAAWSMDIHALRRGVHRADMQVLQYWDALGTQRHTIELTSRETVVVYPKCFELHNILTPPISTLGDVFVKRWIMEDVFFPIGARDYQPGDNIRFVDWKQTARVGQLQSRVFDFTATEELYIIMNLQREVPNETDLQREEVMEQCIRLAASVARQAVREGYDVGFYANGGCTSMAGHTLTLEPVSQAESALMEYMARMANYNSMRFARFVHSIASHIPSAARVIVVSAYLDNDMENALQGLQARVNGLEVLLYPDVDPRFTGGLHVRWLNQYLPGAPFQEVNTHVG